MMDSLRHNVPALYSLLRVILISVVAGLAIALTFKSATLMSPKFTILAEAVYWDARAFLYDGHDGQVRPVTHFTAEVKGLTKEGHVVFVYASKDGYKTVTAEFADLIITDLKGTSTIINRYRGKTIFVDHYQYTADGKIHDCVVLWDEFESPLNLELVERQFAKPVESPPTNVVNTLLASYYWRKLVE